MNWIKDKILKYLVNRLGEQSTLDGFVLWVVAYAASHGIIITDPQQAALTALVVAAWGAFKVFLPDRIFRAASK